MLVTFVILLRYLLDVFCSNRQTCQIFSVHFHRTNLGTSNSRSFASPTRQVSQAKPSSLDRFAPTKRQTFLFRSLINVDKMLFSTVFMQLLATLLFFAQEVFGKPVPGYVTLINATPYDWKLTASHSYQLEWSFPKVIPAGTVHEQYIKFKKDHHDDGAEAHYALVNSPSQASFVIKARPPKHIEIQFQDNLSSLNNPESSVINLGFVKNGAVFFVLSGDTGSYVSSNPPVAWMQATLSNIGTKSLREITVPASHNSGMNEVTLSWGGHPHNTQTQTTNTFKQLVIGVRVFDIRPTYYKRKFYTGHFSKFGSGMVGGTGRKISDIVEDINAFTNQYPGELIVLDISHQMDADNKFRDLSQGKWVKFFEEMNKIEALWVPSSADVPDDLSSIPLLTFITPGSKSAVLVRLPNGAPLPESSIIPRSPMKHDIAANIMVASATRTDHTDGMMPLGPALNGDDNENPTFTDKGAIEPTPSILTPDQRAENDDYGFSASDDNFNSSDNDNTADPTPTNLLSDVASFPVPTELLTGPAPEPMPAEVPVPMGTPSMAFFHESRLPIAGSYADTEKSQQLTIDQLAKLARERPNPQAAPHKGVWTITQKSFIHITDVSRKKTSIIGLAIAAHRALFAKLWPAMSRNTYPNMIEVDAIHNSQITALCMAINDYFASSRVPLHSARKLRKRRRNDRVEAFLHRGDSGRILRPKSFGGHNIPSGF